MLFICITGSTGSGKTTVVKKIIESPNPGAVVLLPLNLYYKDSSNVPPRQRQSINFAHPDAFEWRLLAEQVQSLREGKSIEQPIYLCVMRTYGICMPTSLSPREVKIK